jgi:hypothetical protein
VHVFGTESTGTLDTIVFLWSWYFLCVFFMLCAQVNIMFLMLLWVCILKTTARFRNTTHSNQSIGLVSQRSRVRFPLWSGKRFSLSGVDTHSE